MEKKKKLTGQQGELMRALDITVDDLIANNDGYISDEQQVAILKRQAYQWQGFLGVSLFLSLFGAGFMGIGYLNPDKLLPISMIALFFLGIGLVMGLGSLFYRQKFKNELANNQVLTVQGIAIVSITLEASHLEINGMKLHASPDVLRRVQHLQPYVIHYLPDSKVILSMEHISEESNIREGSAQNRLQDHISNDENLNHYDASDAYQSNSSNSN